MGRVRARAIAEREQTSAKEVKQDDGALRVREDGVVKRRLLLVCAVKLDKRAVQW